MIELTNEHVAELITSLNVRLDRLEGEERLGGVPPTERMHTYLEGKEAGISTIVTDVDEVKRKRKVLTEIKELLLSEVRKAKFRFGLFEVEKEEVLPTRPSSSIFKQ